MTVWERARAWRAEDPDPETASLLDEALARGDQPVLEEWFGPPLTFGTAGMRGALGPGPARMNRVVVRRVTAGLAAAIVHTPGPVIVGYDGRKNSRVFAEDAARVLLGAGRDVFLAPTVCATPALAHAVLALGAAAGVMVTASHNPPIDNGYKVYAANGAQIVPPLDGHIVDAIAQVGPTDALPLGAISQAKPIPSWVTDAYVAAVLALRRHPGEGGPTIVYTAMHGVGHALLDTVLRAAGRSVVPVPDQRDPDPTFPTVAFPNPEEPGALDRAIALAQAVGAAAIIAHDPDADRLAVAIPRPGGWERLTGNQIGCLLAEDLLTHSEGGRRMVATTVVSSRLLSKIAARHGAAYEETLTGFKWIANAAIPFDAAGGRFVLGYEEAIGYSAGSVVRDKDGVSAALLLIDLVCWLAEQGRTLADAWDDLCRVHGVHRSGQANATLPGSAGRAKIRAITAALRASPPAVIAGADVVRLLDLTCGEVRDLRTGDISRSTLPRSDVLGFDLADGSRVLVRPSGTEPKIKIYAEVCEPVGVDGSVSAADARAVSRLDALIADLRARTGL